MTLQESGTAPEALPEPVPLMGCPYKSNPYPLYERMRESGPVHRVLFPSGVHAWLVTGYDAAHSALGDDRLGKNHDRGNDRWRARVIICSDGHVFGDLIRVPDDHIDAYADGLRRLIRESDLHRLSVFDLRDVLGGLPHDTKRAQVHERYAPTLEALRAEVRAEDHTLALYRGITRFLVDDTADFTGTRSALQRTCRTRAYGVIQRSRAWGDLIAEHHPGSVRLSIHPQPVGAPKFGIRLLHAADVWTTPWHSAALHRTDGTWTLMPRARAERLGRLVHRDGRPSHYEQG
ncbi:L-tyrosine/L-tryptophan isonitrile synthase family protein [Streptomyces sp. PSAA01]|uniref:L-tyrosine/L-tryptophan isonitrile synthase family protein n=1 Tax=Streptomyces sp. PSAA01 TaxID=2912762 RepID=UPI001F2130FF|nr:L-tyrosine/L-tryptophan isonitrile synthase family protein [Streptomyces sp. PSAA01]MCG0285761.1 L-tyrosine/L-tryptophan isonitrile synthase family protein [Streptomyces sp. PSAA01]